MDEHQIFREVRIKRELKKARKAKKDKKAKKTKRDKKEKKAKKVVQDAVVAGNDVIFFSMTTDLLCTDEGLIKVPAGAKYTAEDVTAVITYAATTTANSLEAAARELKRKMPDAAIPSADTIFSYIYKENRIDELLSYFRQINSGCSPRKIGLINWQEI
jgi:hypothetical protein